jgi:hypothetical protein
VSEGNKKKKSHTHTTEANKKSILSGGSAQVLVWIAFFSSLLDTLDDVVV